MDAAVDLNFVRMRQVHRFWQIGAAVAVVLSWLSFPSNTANVAAHVGVRAFNTIVGACYIMLPLRWLFVSRRLVDVHTVLACAALVALQATNAVAALDDVDEFLFCSSSQLTAIFLMYTALVTWVWLKSWRIYLFSVLAFLPSTVEPIITGIAIPGTWEFSRLRAGNAAAIVSTYLSVEAVFACLFTLCIISNLAYTREAAQEAALRSQLVQQSAKAQALLETVVPAPVARALAAGVPTRELTQSFPTACVAFLVLADFESLVQSLPPHELLCHIAAIWDAFDGLLDASGGTLLKIETVLGGYVVAALPGLLAASTTTSAAGGQDPSKHPGAAGGQDPTLLLHASTALAQFCVAVLHLCQAGIDGAPINVKIGVNAGPVTAGIVGHSRQFYRLFGDTMNVASRMMSTAPLNAVQASQSFVDALASAPAAPTAVVVRPHGLVDVKGRGRMSTFFLSSPQGGGGSPSRGTAASTPSQPVSARTPELLKAVGSYYGVGTTARTLLVAQTYLDRAMLPLATDVEDGGEEEGNAAPVALPLRGSSLGAGGLLLRQRMRERREVESSFHRMSTLRLASLGEAALAAAVAPSPPASKPLAAAVALSPAAAPKPAVATVPAHGLTPIRRPSAANYGAGDGSNAEPRYSWRLPVSATATAAALYQHGMDTTMEVGVESALLNSTPTASSPVARYDSPLTGRANSSTRAGCVATTPIPREDPPQQRLEGSATASSFSSQSLRAVVPSGGIGPIGSITRRMFSSLKPRFGGSGKLASLDATAVAVEPSDAGGSRSSVLRAPPVVVALVPRRQCPLPACPQALLAMLQHCRAAASRAVAILSMPLPVPSVELRACAALDARCAEASARQLWVAFALVFTRAILAIADAALNPGDPSLSILAVLVAVFVAALGAGAALVTRLVRQLREAVMPAVGSSAAVAAAAGALGLAGSSSAVRRSSVESTRASASVSRKLAIAVRTVWMVVATIFLFVTLDVFVSIGAVDAEVAAGRESSRADAIGRLYVPMMIAASCPLHLRFRLVHTVAALVPLAVASVLPLALAPPPLGDTGWGVCLVLCACGVSVITCYLRESGDRSLFVSRVAAEAAERDATYLLRALLPPQVVSPILDGREVVSRVHPRCAILFLDLVGFTRLAADMAPGDLMTVLNTLYSRFDDAVARRGLWKAETIGDAYIAIAGMFEEEGTEAEGSGGAGVGGSSASSDSALAAASARVRTRVESAIDLALAMQRDLAAVRAGTALDLRMRVGVHLGDVTAGMLGTLRPRFEVLGAAVLAAERLQSRAPVGGILVSAAAHDACDHQQQPASEGPTTARTEAGGVTTARTPYQLRRAVPCGSGSSTPTAAAAAAAVAVAAEDEPTAYEVTPFRSCAIGPSLA